MNVENKNYMNGIPYFSIIIPVYNVNLQYFEICMQSILQQTYDCFEVILVDDGSKTECAVACDRYALEDKRVRVIHQKNNGVSSARNNGINAASAEWIIFVDADDWLETNACEKLKNHLNNIECDILLFNAVKEYAGKQQNMNYGLNNGSLYLMEDLTTREMLYRRAMGAPNTKEGKFCVIYYSWDKVYKRSFLVNNQIQFPVGIPKSEDKIFVLSCFEKMQSLYYIDTVLYHYRINQESVCNRYSENADSDRIALTLKLKEIAERMDSEIKEKKNVDSYDNIKKQFYRFSFGIISDVLRLKFFHPDYPRDKRQRAEEVKAFLNTEPFRSSLRLIKYSELPRDAKIKKFMLTHGMTASFCKFKEIKRKAAGKKAE